MSDHILLLPKCHHDPVAWAILIAKQKGLRLQSLLTSPESFSSTYERESSFDDSDWEARLQNPLAYTYIARSRLQPSLSTNHVHTPEETLGIFLHSDWVGSATLFGPATTGSDSDESVVMDVYGLFVLPEARGSGLGSALLDRCVEHARNVARGMKVHKAVVRVSVARGNEKVLRLYEKVGFTEDRTKAEASLGPGVTTLIKAVEV